MEKPLIYEDIWDLPPYTFLNKDGEPSGFNIDLIKKILRKLDIPYIIKLKPTADAYNDLKEGKSDLMFGMYTDYHSQFGHYSNSVVGLFTHGVARPLHDKAPINSTDELKNMKLVMQRNSVSHRYMVENGMEESTLPSDDISDAILKVAARDSGQVLWNTLSLKYTLKKYDIHNLEITPVNIPNGEYRFMSGDKHLLELIDSVYEDMTQNEEIMPIRRKWFYPEMKESGIPDVAWYIAGALALICLLLIGFNWIYRIRERRVNLINEKLNRRLALYMKSGKIQMWAYDIARDRFITFSPEGNELDEYNKHGFASFFNKDDYRQICSALNSVKEGHEETRSLQARCHRPSTPEKEHYFDMTVSVLRRNEGKPSMLLVTQHNITEERRKYFEQKDTHLKFQTIFNTVNVDMALYDNRGRLIALNAKAKRTLGSNQNISAFGKLNLTDILKHIGITAKAYDTVYTSVIIKQYGKDRLILPPDITYYELMVQPIFHDGEIIRYFVTGRDMTEQAVNMNDERRNEQLIRESVEKQKEYTENINYDLEVNHIWLTRYYPDTKTIKITHDPHKPELTLSQIRCLQLIAPTDRQKVMRLINTMDKHRTGIFDIKVKTLFSDNKQRDLYLQWSGMPIRDDNGHIDHYYGLCRNISKMEETERRLKEEMQKARDAEIVKNAFVKNMSYEIRTPLNAVMGFAELFDMEHSPEDEPVFMNEIRSNSNMLLKIVNDILMLSRIDANMIEIKPESVDFAEIFAAHCMLGWNQELAPGVNTSVESPYEHLVVDIDATQTGNIIEIIAANAAHFTARGTIRGRYEYHHGELIISIEDSGVGIEADILSNMFGQVDYFEDVDHSSIRLRLLICKKLVEKMGGRIDIESEPGYGTTVWLTIPCKAHAMEKKNITV